MTAMRDCPSEEQLRALLDDRLEPEVSRQIIEHIDHCTVCQAKLSGSMGLGELASQLRNIDIGKHVSPSLQTALESTKRMSVPIHGRDSAPVNRGIELTPEVTAFTQDGYDLMDQIGQGGMGIVFRAREWSLDRIVAVKVLSPLLAADPSSKTRFLREARSAAAIVHPNVITIHAVSEKHALPYIVSEFVEGVSLQQQLDSGAGISLDNIIRIGKQIAAGLSAAHAKGVIHRDVKPANIFLNAKTGKVLLGDFGLARSSDQGHLTRTGTLLGTPAYIAPELLEDPKSADQRADLFSLGAVMYAMCTGDSPFAADTLLGTLQRLSSFQPEPLVARVRGTPEWFSLIVMKLLARNPDDRFQSAKEFREALGQGNGLAQPTELEWQPAPAGAALTSGFVSNDTPTRNALDATIPLMETADQRDANAFVINTDADSTRSTPKRKNPNRRSLGWKLGVATFVLVLGLASLPLMFPSSSETPNANSVTGSKSSSESAQPLTTQDERSSFAPGWQTDWDGDHFVCLNASGTPIGRFESLQQALEACDPQGRIEIRTNETIAVDSCCLIESDVTLVGGQDYTPVLEFVGGEDVELDAMFHVESRLTLRGLELRIPEDTDSEDVTLIHVEAAGELQMDECLLIAESTGICLSTHASVSLNDCQVHSPQSTAFELESHEGSLIQLQNCWVSGETVFSFSGEDSQQIQLADCSFACEQFLSSFEEDPTSLESLSIRSERSVFFCGVSFLVVETFFEDLDRFFDWQGSKNVFSNGRFLLLESDDPSDDRQMVENDQWPQTLRQSGSFSDRPYEMDLDVLFEQIPNARFRLASVKTSADVAVGARDQ